MPSLIDENTQFTDTDGLPIVNGTIFIGVQNTDPVANPLIIYSDRDLTTPISNPQSLNSYGRSSNKIWIPGKYSVQVNNSASVQKFQDLDAGDVTQTGISVLSNVQGTNTITAEGSPAIATLTDQQQYNFTTAAANTGAVTLQIDLTAAKSILKQHDVALVSGDLEANQIVAVIYNATDDVFELVSNALTSDFTSLTVGGDPVVPARAVVANHTRAGNRQLTNGGFSITAYDVDLNVADNVWESFGPTGSGADNIYDEMDVIPATATMVILLLDCSGYADTASYGTLEVQAAHGDVASPGDFYGNVIGFMRAGDANATNAEAGTLSVFVEIPINSSGVFKMKYKGNFLSSGTENVNIIYKGFMTD